MENTTSATRPSLEAHQYELAERLLQFGFFLDLCLGDFANNNPGHRVLGINGNEPVISAVAPGELDVQQYRVGRILPFLYDYAYNARRVEGAIDWREWNSEADERYVFGGFIEMTNVENVRCASAEYNYDVTNYLPAMLRLADARQRLDFDEDLSIEDVALLADMNERSVRNALRAEGENQLVSEDGEQVRAADALRWLRGRRGGFRETTVVALDGESLPDVLSYAEIPFFIERRLERLFPLQDSDADDCCRPTEKAAKRLGWAVSKVFAMTRDTANIRPQDCTALAGVLRVDPAWFTEQVMCALFPKQMSLIAFRKEIEEPDPEEVPSFIEVELTENGIRHGYLDISASLSSFFPADCFGSKGSGKRGKEVELRYAGQARQTDIRIKSSITISPRARFVSYFSKMNAKAGDVVRVGRIDERTYELTFIAK